jgi:hypothetical protein
MVRIIYYVPKLGYRIQDRASPAEILLLETSLTCANASVVCIVDFKNKLVSNKCLDFLEHMDRIDPLLFEADFVQL